MHHCVNPNCRYIGLYVYIMYIVHSFSTRCQPLGMQVISNECSLLCVCFGFSASVFDNSPRVQGVVIWNFVAVEVRPYKYTQRAML
jgi:hypothetical protein